MEDVKETDTAKQHPADTNANADTDDTNLQKSDTQDTDGLDVDGTTKSNNEQDNDDIYGSPEAYDYSEIKLPEGMELDQDLVQDFEPVAKKLNLSNKSANELMNLAVKLSNKNLSVVQEAIKQSQIAEMNSYEKLLAEDKELNVNDNAKYHQYLDVANKGIEAVATDGFKKFIKDKGLTYHPEFIKVFHKIGKLCQDAQIPDVKNPVGKEERQADVLYGKNTD